MEAVYLVKGIAMAAKKYLNLDLLVADKVIVALKDSWAKVNK